MTFDSDSRRLSLAMSGSRLGLWDWNMVTGETVFNDRWAEIIGYQLPELEPTSIDTWITYCHPDDLERSTAAIQAHISGDADFYDVELRMRHKDGHWVWVHDRGKIVEREEDGTPMRMVGTHDDVSERVKADQDLRRAAVVFDNSLEGVVITDSDFTITATNPAFGAITGWPAESLVGIDVLHFIDPSISSERRERVRSLANSPGGVRSEVTVTDPDGTSKPMLFSAHVVGGDFGDLAGYVCQLSDLSQTKVAELTRLEVARAFDPTTGLPNRDKFTADLQTDLLTTRWSQRKGAIAVINIDNFRQIVDVFGFHRSEALIKELAESLRENLRPGDALARLAGDEFAVYLLGREQPREIEEAVQGLLDEIHAVRHVPEGSEVVITASAGVAAITSQEPSASQLIHEAVAAVHAAKSWGVGQIAFAEEEFVDAARSRLELAAKLREGWINDEFRVEYQPSFDVGTNKIVGAEALMRWNSPHLGEVSPGDFIPAAEEAGLIVHFGSWVLRQACAVGADLIASGMSDCQVSVNVSVTQLQSPGFADVVVDALQGSGLPPDRLKLEITEGVFMQASEAVADSFAQLTCLGVQFSIDDFGTGYSSFAYLARYPVDELKIDRSFIINIASDGGSQAIVAAMIDMAHHLGITVVAEGVESQEQLRVLRTLGCDSYQGFLESPAIPVESLKQAYA